MSGSKTGVVTKIQEIEKKAVYIHCHGHLVNLATADCLKKSRILKDVLEYSIEIVKLIKKSPKRESKLNQINQEAGNMNKGIKTLCHTRWTVKANAIKSILDNYSALIETFEKDVEESKSMPFEMKSSLEGMASKMEDFRTYFGMRLAHFTLRHTDILATQLQKKDLSAAQGYELVKMTVRILEAENTEEKFRQFFDIVTEEAKNVK